VTPASAAVTFGEDAWRVIRNPDFGAFKPPDVEPHKPVDIGGTQPPRPSPDGA
jgi:hypothetical protein